MTHPSIGVIADDLTGATDLALMASERGLRSAVCPWPLRSPAPPAEVIVAALRSRTAPVERAVAQSRAALRWLREQGATRFHFKYCSTFDSTPRGNIGPVIEVLLDELDAEMTVVVPAFPAAGRTVYQARLFVGEELLEESSMRHHPLTPMRDSHLVRLLRPQLRPGSPVTAVGLEEVRGDLRGALDRERERGARAVVLDTVEDADLLAIHDATGELALTTGSSGLALTWGQPGPPAAERVGAPGPAVSLVGSQSAASAEQVSRARRHQPAFSLSPPRDTSDTVRLTEEAVRWCLDRWTEDPRRPVLVHATPLEGKRADADAAGRLEEAFASIARDLAARGVRRFVVGGGETSGSVVGALGVGALRIGPAIAPGVCWAAGELDPALLPTVPDLAPGVPRETTLTCALALKSGNFGGPELLSQAWGSLS